MRLDIFIGISTPHRGFSGVDRVLIAITQRSLGRVCGQGYKPQLIRVGMCTVGLGTLASDQA